MKKYIFDKKIQPSCQYCSFGVLTKDVNVILCPRKGSVSALSSCKLFEYAPLKRQIKRFAPLPQFSKEDFEL